MENESQVPVTPANQAPQRFNWSLWAIVVLVLALAAVGAFYLKQKVGPVPPVDNNQEDQTDNTPEANEPLVSGSVEWKYPVETQLSLMSKSDLEQYSKYYILGTFKTGPYNGKFVYAALLPTCEGPCPSAALKLTDGEVRGQSYMILQNHSTPLDNFEDGFLNMGKLKLDSSLKISDLVVPETLTGPNAGQTLTVAEPSFFQAPYNLFNATNLKLVYNDLKVGPVYTTPDNLDSVEGFYQRHAFYVKAPDWNTLTYKLVPPFTSQNNVPEVTFHQGGKNTAEYIYNTIGGCGFSDYAAVVSSSEVKKSDLVEAGKTGQGESIYEFKDVNHAFLKNAYENDYNPYQETKVTYQEYTSRHPVFFWTDPFGRMIKFRRSEFVRTAAECAKPVIYLYPEKTTNVNVELNPVGGFTFTEPLYNNGWKVSAKPNGQLTNLSDGKIYPYLFWEGYGGLYQTPERGFVVARADVHKFFVEKLAQLGLNNQESADFREYWEPYFTGAPHYFITFMGNQAADEIAPLRVEPKPDTIIRVLMDFKPLDKPIEVQEFNIKTPVRRGFTVVEWGGVKH